MSTIVDFNNLALAQTGVPYVFGGVNLAGTPNPGLDCSGLPYAVSLALGKSIPRTSEAQFAGLTRISQPNRRGDLVFYDVASDDQAQPAHEAIWWDSGHVLQAPRTGENVGVYPNSALPYPIMGYCQLPFPNVAPSPAPPIPEEYEEMSSVVLDDGTIVSYVVNMSGHLIEITRHAGTAGVPASGQNMSVLDLTDAFPNQLSGVAP